MCPIVLARVKAYFLGQYLTEAKRLRPDKMLASFASKPFSPRRPGNDAAGSAGDAGEMTPRTDSCVHAESARRSLLRTLSLSSQSARREEGRVSGCVAVRSHFNGRLLMVSFQRPCQRGRVGQFQPSCFNARSPVRIVFVSTESPPLHPAVRLDSVRRSPHSLFSDLVDSKRAAAASALASTP